MIRLLLNPGTLAILIGELLLLRVRHRTGMTVAHGILRGMIECTILRLPGDIRDRKLVRECE